MLVTRSRALAALALATALVGGTLTAAALPAGAAEPPTVHVDKTAVSADGDSVTVTGTGFDPSLSVGTRPPLAGQPSGAYVVFAAFPDNWRPSEGGTRSSILTQRWAVPAAGFALIGGAAAGAVLLNADGSFTATLPVSRDDSLAADLNYGIYTYAASGAVVASYETYTPITFATNVPAEKAAAKAKLTLVKKKVKKSKRAKVKVAVTAAGTTPTGKVVVKERGKKLASLTLANGKAKAKLPKLSKGKHKLRAVYRGSVTVARATSTTKKLRVV